MSPHKWIAAILAVAYLCLTNVAVFAEDINYRLPLNIKPINYRLILKPYLNESDTRKFTFDGECWIEIEAAQDTNEIQLHIKNLNISVSEYYRKGKLKIYNLAIVKPDPLTDIVAYKLNKMLKANVTYILHYCYNGSINADLKGFYRSSYTTAENITKWLAVTHFDKTNARRVFPCFDEPIFKATFDLSLTHHHSLNSTGPTKPYFTDTKGEYITVFYHTTPKMSTYVFGFIVSEFRERSDGQFGILARPDYYSLTEYCFNVGKKLLKILDDYMDIPYYSMGIDKLQMAAIPDFSANAMENWGIITYRERRLLYDEQHTTLKSKQDSASIVAHELTHMWFGNLVTSDWSYIWLKEGFARYFQYHAIDMIDANYEMSYQFVVERLQVVMEMDATNSTKPMSNENIDTLGIISSNVAYNKGGALIRATKHILGENYFKTSVRVYLKQYQYTNTIPSDIFKIWKNYWPVKYFRYADRFYASFTTQVGYPVVTFNRTSKITYEVSQKRFLLKDFDKADRNLLYTIPITYTTNIHKRFQYMDPKFFLEKNLIQIRVPRDTKWLIGNIQEIGYYRVNYDRETWYKIKASLHAEHWDGIHELNRAQIVDDLFNFARAGEIEYGVAFDVLDYLKTETNYFPWTSAFKGLSFLATHLGGVNKGFAEYIRHITEKAYNNLGFEEQENDSPLDIYTRADILSWSCKYGNPECISKAKLYFNKNLKANPVPVNIRSVVYCTAMREAKKKDFAKLYDKYKTETVTTEKMLLLKAMGCVRDSKLVSNVFHIIMSKEVRFQHKSNALSNLCTENNENVDLVFDLVEKNIDQLSKVMRGYTAVFTIMLNIADHFTTEAQFYKLILFKDRQHLKYSGMLEEIIARVRSNLNWSKANLAPVKRRFEKPSKTYIIVFIVSALFVGFLILICPCRALLRTRTYAMSIFIVYN